MKEVERKQSSTSALISEEDQCREEISMVTLSESENSDYPAVDFLASRKVIPSAAASTAAQREYAAAMKVIGSSSARRSAGSPMSLKRSRPQPSALLLEDEIEDDWLEKDIPSPPARKPCRKPNSSSSSHAGSDRVSRPKTTPKPASRLSLSGRTGSSDSRSVASHGSSPDHENEYDDDFQDEAPPSAKRAKPSPTVLQISEDSSSNDRVSSPVLSGPKRPKKPIQLTMDAFTEVAYIT